MSTENAVPSRQRDPWNKGRLIGQKRPLKPRDVWTIRVRLQMEGRKRDLAMFNLAIDSKLRGCDLVRLRIDDVSAGGRVRDRATVIQKKTGRPVQFEITEQTRTAIGEWLITFDARRGRYLFPSRFREPPQLSTRQYARIIHRWVERGLEIDVERARPDTAARHPGINGYYPVSPIMLNPDSRRCQDRADAGALRVGDREALGEIGALRLGRVDADLGQSVVGGV
jgi:hypothetical protein